LFEKVERKKKKKKEKGKKDLFFFVFLCDTTISGLTKGNRQKGLHHAWLRSIIVELLMIQ
jgi:hypothetical protein